MADSDILPQDVQEAASFMQSFLLAKIPDGDFTEGSALYDHTIQAFAFLFAYLRKQIGVVRARQSLLTLAQLPPEESVDDATNAILANLLVERSQGEFARGPGVVHFSQRTDVLIPAATRFFKTRSHVFLLESTGDVFLAASDLLPVTAPDGRSTEWVTPALPMVAARTGADYNLAAGPFVGFTRFHPYVTLVENPSGFEGGDGAQATSAYIEGAKTAISLRALLNANSNSAVLRPKFGLNQVVTISAGEPEMARDLVTELGTGVSLHVGGHMDIYVRRPVQQTVERLVVGGEYLRPDGRTVRLAVDPGAGIDFEAGTGITAPVEVGDILAVTAGLPESPFQFKVVLVEPLALTISSRLPFSQATAELTTPPALGLSVGNNYPLFDNKVPLTSSTDFTTNRRITIEEGVVLSPGPVYRVKKVEVLDAGSSFDPFKDPASNTLVFDRRANALPASAPNPGDPLSFVVETLNPAEGQSGMAVTTVRIGWPGVTLDGLTVEVTYDTLSGFSAIDAFVRNEYERPSCAFTLAKGFHPVYLSFTVPYKLPPQRTDLLGAGTIAFDETLAATFLENFVNNYQRLGGIDQSLLATEARTASGVEASIYPFSVSYELVSPSGKVYRFATEDVVTVFPDGSSTARLLNPTEVGLPASGYHSALAKNLRDLGVSDRTTRYLASPGSVTLLRRT